MFGLLTRSPRKRKALAPRTVTLGLERLEDRLALDGSITVPPQPPPAAEQIALTATYLPNRQVTLAGSVTNTNTPGGQTIQFGGVVNGTTTTNANGGFSATLTATALGNATATSTSQPCNTAFVTLVSQKPTINNFQATNEGGGMWLFSGSVTGAPVQGETVDFGGIAALAGKSVTVNADGTFSFCVMVQIAQGGMAWAEAVDWWGDTSDPAQTPVGA